MTQHYIRIIRTYVFRTVSQCVKSIYKNKHVQNLLFKNNKPLTRGRYSKYKRFDRTNCMFRVSTGKKPDIQCTDNTRLFMLRNIVIRTYTVEGGEKITIFKNQQKCVPTEFRVIPQTRTITRQKAAAVVSPPLYWLSLIQPCVRV